MDTVDLDAAVRPVGADASDYDGLLARMGDARFVLLGEATHGTHQFYRERARITARLLEEGGFDAVTVEADWPDAMRATRWALGEGSDRDADEALGDFERFPTWMWRNADVVGLLRFLREHNARTGARIGFYGLDLYSLHRSMDAVVRYLERRDPEAARRAKQHYACVEAYGADPAHYGRRTAWGVDEDCEAEVVQELREMQAVRMRAWESQVGSPDEAFFAEQNARVAASAEQYYREMFRGQHSSWNLRDTHMADTLDALDAHLSRRKGRPARIVVWAHNSHLGDARASEMAEWGEVNLGQLCRERHEKETFIVGFTTTSGMVTAARSWGDPPSRMRVRPARPDSWEAQLHAVGEPRFWLDCRDPRVRGKLGQDRLQRFIGVVYAPHTERQSHYFATRLGEQYDAVLHFDVTHAVEPLDRAAGWEAGELPETYPSAL